jgi:hypothetical protein
MTNAMSPNARRAYATGAVVLCLATPSPAIVAAQDLSAEPAGREAHLDAVRARKAEDHGDDAPRHLRRGPRRRGAHVRRRIERRLALSPRCARRSDCQGPQQTLQQRAERALLGRSQPGNRMYKGACHSPRAIAVFGVA